VFTHGMRSGSTLDALLADACVVVSLLLQHGVEPADLAASMGRLGNAEPASVIGAVIDLVSRRCRSRCSRRSRDATVS
jgi:2-keto-3-deoxy-L-rhamnonate aldolase RhmA